jgi:hypothetical protein
MLNQPACEPSTLTPTHFFVHAATLNSLISCQTRGWHIQFKILSKQRKVALRTAAPEMQRPTTCKNEQQAVSHNMRDKSPAQYTIFAIQELLNPEASGTAGLASVLVRWNHHHTRTPCKHSTARDPRQCICRGQPPEQHMNKLSLIKTRCLSQV